VADEALDQEAPPASEDQTAEPVAAEPTDQEPPSPESAPDEPQGDQPGSLDEAIKAVLPDEDEPTEDPEGDGDEASKETAPADKDPARDGPDAETKPKEPADDELTEEDKSLRPNAQKRIGQLLHERKDLRTEVATLKQDAEAAAPLARDMTQIREFMASNDLGTDHATQLFDFGAKYRRGDWAGVLEIIKPIMDQAQVALGHVLSEDLQTMVSDVRLREEDAKAISLSRGKLQTEATTQQAAAARATAERDQNQRINVEALSGQIKTAMNNWVEQQKAKDPDFDRKSSLLMDLAKAHATSNGTPATAQDAVAVMDAIYANVTGSIAPPADPVKPTAKTPDGLSGNAPTTATAPKTLTEAILTA